MEAEENCPAVLLPAINWKFVALHEGNMDAITGISVLDRFAVGLIYTPPSA